MKALSVLLALALTSVVAVHAEDAPSEQGNPTPAETTPSNPPPSDAPAKPEGNPPLEKTPQLAPEPTVPEDSTATPPPSLIPQTETTFVKPAQSFRTKKEKKSKTEQAEDDLLKRIWFRQAMTHVLADPTVQEAWRSSQGTRTDYEQREALKRYYTLLYDKMLKVEPRAALLIADAKKAAIARETQTKLKPTEAPNYLRTAAAR